MADLLHRGLQWLEQQRAKYLTVTVIYQRGATATELLATVGHSAFELIDSNGVVLHFESRDYLIAASQLATAPRPGDRILDAAHVYEVSEMGSEPAWRWSDPYRLTYRVHCKEVKG